MDALNIPKRLREIDELLAANRVEDARAKLKELGGVFRMFCQLLGAVEPEPPEDAA